MTNIGKLIIKLAGNFCWEVIWSSLRPLKVVKGEFGDNYP